MVRRFDVVLDGSDNFATRYALSDTCYHERRPLVSAALGEFDGTLTTLKPYENGPDGKPNPTYRCLFPEAPPPGTIPTCAEAGMLGALAGVLGSLMAMEAIRVIVGGFGAGDEGLIGRLLMIDARAMRFETLRYAWDPDNPLSGKKLSARGAARGAEPISSARPRTPLCGIDEAHAIVAARIEAALSSAAVIERVEDPVADEDERRDREKRDDIGECPALEITLLRLPAPRQVQAIEFVFLRSSLRHCFALSRIGPARNHWPIGAFIRRGRALLNGRRHFNVFDQLDIILSGHSGTRGTSPPFDPETGHAPPRCLLRSRASSRPFHPFACLQRWRHRLHAPAASSGRKRLWRGAPSRPSRIAHARPVRRRLHRSAADRRPGARAAEDRPDGRTRCRTWKPDPRRSSSARKSTIRGPRRRERLSSTRPTSSCF